MGSMARLRRRKSLVLFAAAVLALAAFAPAIAGLPVTLLTPLWLVVPMVVVTIVRRRAVSSDEQPVALLSLFTSRAPPAPLVLA